jgi:chemotaxis protein CheX
LLQDTTIVAYRENVEQVVETVFKTMLGLNVEPYPIPWDRPQDMITAAVYFAGVWRGAVLLECTRAQAIAFAQLFLPIASPRIDDDVRDALGELANMLAGNLKSVLTKGVMLSMPSVIEGSDYSLKICGNGRVERVPFWCVDDVFGVTLVKMADPADID